MDFELFKELYLQSEEACIMAFYIPEQEVASFAGANLIENKCFMTE